MGGGFPIGAMITTTKIAASFVPGTHGSTYGGNPLGCAVSLAVLEAINTPEMMSHVKEQSAKIKSGLEAIGEKYGVFSEVRGKGMLLGAVLSDEWKGKARQFLEAGWANGVMCLVAGADVVRFAPAATITDKDIEEGLARFDKAISNLVS